jgi:hypothetical protein
LVRAAELNSQVPPSKMLLAGPIDPLREACMSADRPKVLERGTGHVHAG